MSVYHQPTVDSLFKYLMSFEEIRNSLLSAILDEHISYSELVDVALNPFPTFKTLRELVNRSDIKTLMEEIELLPEGLEINKNKVLNKRALQFMQDLAPLHAQLSAMIPSPERQTSLDIVCRSSYGLINVEMQVEPQNYYDLRILDHVCGLFHRQFGRGFRWKELENNDNISEKISRVVGISLFEKPPKYPETVQALLPWYQMKPWGEDELSRHFRLCDKNDPEILRTGIEFLDFNLEAYVILHAKHGLDQYPKALCEWLEFFAKAHTKTMDQVKQGDYSSSVNKAYEIIRDLPPELEERYGVDLLNRENISFYVQGIREESKEEGREEGREEGEAIGEAKEKRAIAKNLKNEGFSPEKIATLTGLAITEIENL